MKARHIQSGTEIAVKAFKCKNDTEAAERDRELEVLRIVSLAGHARAYLTSLNMHLLKPLCFFALAR